MGAGAQIAVQVASNAGAAAAVGYGAWAEAGAYKANAEMSRKEATFARLSAYVQEKAYRRDMERVIGTARAVAGATGFGQEGTNADLIDEIRRDGEIDAAMIRLGGEISAWRLEREAEIQEKQAKQTRVAGLMGAASTFLGGSGTQSMLGGKQQSSWGGK